MTPVTATRAGDETPANALVRAIGAPVTCAGFRGDGERCGSRILLADGFCNQHSPSTRVDAVELGRTGGLRSGEVRREQSRSVRDRLRDKVEENMELIWGAFNAALTSDDERAQLAGAVSLLAEVYGKPAVTVGGGDRPVKLELVSLLAMGQAAGELTEGESS